MGRGSKNLSKGNRKLALMHQTESLHYRMYKAGRTWLFAGIATFSLGAVLFGSQVQASAATTEDTTPTTQVTKPVADSNIGADAGQAADPNSGATAQQQPATTQAQPAANTDTATTGDTMGTGQAATNTDATATSDTTGTGQAAANTDAATTGDTTEAGQAAANTDPATTGAASDTTGDQTDQASTAVPGQITKNTSSNVGIKVGTVTGNEGTVTAPAGASKEPDTSGALIKGNLFGSGLENASENSSTAGVGADSIDNANRANDRKTDGTGTYGNVYGDKNPDPIAQAGANGQYTLIHANGDVNSKNDGLDQKITDNQVPEDTITVDHINDQGAISSDSSNLITNVDPNDPKKFVDNTGRGATIYSSAGTSGVDVSLVGGSDNGVNIGIPTNLKSSLQVGTLQVLNQTAVGITVKNPLTGEQFQITDSDYGTEGKYKDTYKVGSNIDGKAVYNAVLNGGVVRDVVGFVTKGISGLSGAAGGIGKALIGQGKSLLGDNLKNALEHPTDPSNILNVGSIVSEATSLGDRLGATFTQDGENNIGVSDIVATLVDLLPLLGVNTTDFQDAYQGLINQANDSIDELNKFGDNLMKDGMSISGLADATIKTDTSNGDSKNYIEVLAGSDLSTAYAVTNMFKSYIEGWSQGIADSLDAVFAGDQPIVHPDAQNDPDDLYRFNGQTPISILDKAIKAAEDKGGLGGFLLKIGDPIIEGAIKGLSSLNNGAVQPVITAINGWVTDNLGKGIDEMIGGSLGGETQNVAVPINWTDPKFVDQASGQNADAGQFVNETFDTAAKVFDAVSKSQTTIAYQNVDKTQLNQLINDATTMQDVTPDSKALAVAVAADPDASQYDVDQAIIKLGKQITLKQSDAVGNAKVKDFTAPKTETTPDEVSADELVNNFSITPQSGISAEDAAAINAIYESVKSQLGKADFAIDPIDPATNKAKYTLSKSGVKKVQDALTAAKSNFQMPKAPAQAEITFGDAGADTTPTDNNTDNNTDTDATYTLQAIDEAGHVLPGSTLADLSGKTGDAIDAAKLAATYKDANDKTWYKPAAESLASYFIKNGATINVLYTDKDVTGTDGHGGSDAVVDGGSFIINDDGTITFTDKNGKTLTIDPSKWGSGSSSNGTGQPININITNNNDDNDNGGSSTGTDGTGSTTGTDNGGGSTTTPVQIILPGQDGTKGGADVTKNTDGSLTFTFPDGSTQTVQPGDNNTKTNPNGGSFKVNPDGTITFTDAGGNSYTVDPNNKTNGTTQPGSKITNIVLPGANKDGNNAGDQTLMIEKTPSGDIVLHLPDGSTQTITSEKPGALPDGSSVVINPDGTITITDPNGNKETIDPNKGQSLPTDHADAGGQTATNTVDTDGDGIPDSFEGTVGTNANSKDTDGDGDSDLQEVLNGTNPKDPNSNLKSLENGKGSDGTGSTININGGTVIVGGTGTDGTNGSTGINGAGTDGKNTVTPIVVSIPGKDGKDAGATVTKNSDGSVIFTFPDGSTQTVQPGDNKDKTNPAGGSFVVNPDGTITFTDPSGKTYTIDPSTDKGAGPSSTQPGSKTTVVVIPGQNGTDGANTPDQVVTVEKGTDGTLTLHFPDGSTKVVHINDTDTLPGGGSYVVNPDGTITFTNPDGTTSTIDPSKGTTGNITINTGTGNTGTPGDADGDGISDDFETKIGTNTAKTDSDGDGDTDFQEILNHTNPLDPASNLKSLENGGKDGSTSTTTTITTINNVPGQDGGVKATKNSDGSITFTFPDGSTQTVQPGDTTTPDANGGSFKVNPDGTITFNDGKGNSYTIDPNRGTTTTPIIVTIPGQDGGTQATKNPDGSITFTFPDGSTQTVQPGDATKPDANGGFFKVNPDGTITITNPDGSSYTFDPNNGQDTPTQPGSKSTVIVLPGKDGATSVVTAEKTPNGDIILHLPDGSTQTVEPGKGGTLPDGTKYTYNPDGTLTFVTPEGNTTTINPDNGASGLTTSTSTNTNTTNNNGGTTNNTTNNYYGGNGPATIAITLPAGKDGVPQTITYTKNPDGSVTITTPDGNTKTVQPGDTGTLPNGGTYTVLPNGSLSITNPDGSTTVVNPGNGTNGSGTNNGGDVDTDGDGIPDSFETKAGTDINSIDTDGDGDTDLKEVLNGTNPLDPNSNYKNPGNGGSGTTNGGSTGQPITINIPGQTGAPTVTKNSDGSLTFTFPDGSTQTVQPGDGKDHDNPAGGTFKVNPDGTITFTDGDGNSYTVDPNNRTNGTTQPGSKITNIVLPGKDGTDGKDGADQTVMIEKTPNGDIILHFPDGTTQTVQPGSEGKLPNGTTWIVNPNGTITFTTPDGNQSTYDPNKGETTPTNTNNGGGSTTNTIDTDGDGIPDNFETTVGTNPKKGDTDGDGDTDLQEILNGTDPMDPNSNFKNPGNGGSTNTVQPIVITLPGQNGGTTVTKNSDGSFTINFPDGSKEVVQPGDNSSHVNPAGGSFVVNPDGTITFIDKNGGTTTIDPSKIGGQPTAGDSKTTVIVIPGQPGKDGQPGANTIVTVEKTADGRTIIHLPDGTTKEVQPGDTGELPNGTTYIVNPNGTITFTNPDGTTSTVDPKAGNQGNIFINPGGNNNQGTAKTTVVFIPGKDGNGGMTINVTKQPNGDIIITNPDGSTQTVQPGDHGELPTGATFVINKDGSMTITNPDGSQFTIDPNKGASSMINTGGNVTNNNYYGSNGPSSATITLPGGTDGKGVTITYTKNPDGSFTLTTPTGSDTLKPGQTGTLPNGDKYVVNPDGSLSITNPDGKTFVINPGSPATTNGGNTYYITNNYGTNGSAGTTITLPSGTDGKNVTITYTKNPDGTFTLTTPTGSDTLKPGQTGTLPNGDKFVVNPDGSLSITDNGGKTTVIVPGNGGTIDGRGGDIIVNVTVNGGGSTSNTVETPTGNYTIDVNGDGTYTVTGPDGTPTPKLHIGDTGNVPNGGGSYVVNDGNIVITEPGGQKVTVNINNGGSTTPGGNGDTNTTTPGGNGDTNTTTPGGNGDTNTTTPGGNGDTNTTTPGGNGDTNTTTPGGNGDTNTTTPGGNGGTNTTTPGGNVGTTNTTTTTPSDGTAVTSPTGGATDTTSTAIGDGTATAGNGADTDQGAVVTSGDAGMATGDAGGAVAPGGATAQDTSAGTAATAEGANASSQANGANQAADKSVLPQTDEKPAEGVAALGLLGGLLSLFGLAGTKKRRKNI
ncbi:KxYKxGKxW signal peptide domain-containing protein [Secundilactobacillus yichangensis]|uniref:KxYKxGKxW signal peptide domain-containing protein n=1 Tax=Secundilactobacillus yichangensis TaxID=2799580 RepID=UPI0019454C96|nr:KxYKxGKxW signal peptide domain-containing protein [Secundilactobacillus yichangensis]